MTDWFSSGNTRQPKVPSRPRSAAFACVAGLIVMTALALPATAFESDPYLALRVQLADSASVIDEFLNREIKEALDRVNADERIESCEALPPKVFHHLFANVASSRLKYLLENSPRIQRFPDDNVGYWQYLRSSIYRRPLYPIAVPMSSIIEVGGVRVGVDKFAEMLSEGRQYYKLFLEGLEVGLAPDEAERRAISKRLERNRAAFDSWSSGVISFADLEAGYQGLKLARAMCEGVEPHLGRRGGKWQVRRAVRISDFIVPALDESFYPNRFHSRRWKHVQPILESEHCSILSRPEVQARFERYRRADQLNLSRQVVEAHFADRGIPLGSHSLEAVCASKAAGEIAPNDSE